MDVVSLIRFIATLLITNSHYDKLYPQGFSFLSTGGMIGNALFFWVSGYTLYFSLKKVNGGVIPCIGFCVVSLEFILVCGYFYYFSCA